ncbi:hypothetical protein KVR01_007339 [Diaporthe batatas]|uniref:uncharacterized protein n=1 Tax=Diaporthe batatas TaxID=748121 RepID=UPI001D04DAF7|nr:uncharacterized protein KVR01_007339 [Diaporthe batatas]KAG8162861.1 hypothetical protein KVR01_007339 [Diaporthe batatas]
MKFLSTLVVAMASVAIAQDNNKGDGTSTKSQCKQVAKITKLMDLASNTTKLDKVTEGNATKASEIQAKASQAATKLTELQSNTTLMAACDQIFAVQDTENACEKMQGLEKLQALVANQTALDEKTKGNTTKADAIKAKAQEKAADLTAMQGNATLTGFCAGFQDKQSCKAMAKLAKMQEFAQNTTALNEKFNGDADKIAKFQAKLSSKAEKINAMMSNQTLMDACNSLGITTASTTTGASNSNSSDKKSAAISINAMGAGHVLALVSVLAYAVAML